MRPEKSIHTFSFRENVVVFGVEKKNCILIITHQVCRPFLKTIKQLMPPKVNWNFCVLQLPERELCV